MLLAALHQIAEQAMTQLSQTSWLEYIAVVMGMASVLLSRANNIYTYPTGIAGTLVSIVLFVEAGLYAEAVLNVYYFVMSVYGWWKWARHSPEQAPLPVTLNNRRDWLHTGLFVVLGWPALWAALRFATDSTVPVLDAFVSATAWCGMWLMAKRKVENWLLLNLSNIVAIFLLWYKGLYFLSLLTLFLFIVAIFGYFSWRKTALQREQIPA
jgi:nicotinamide mononucleotide transporter